MSSAAFLILMNSMLCVVAIYAALYWSSDVLGLCLLLQSAGILAAVYFIHFFSTLLLLTVKRIGINLSPEVRKHFL